MVLSRSPSCKRPGAGYSAPMSDEKPQITAYLKTFCGWSEGVRAIMRKYDLEYTEKDIIKNPAFRWEMEQKSGQPLSPCVLVNGTMLNVSLGLMDRDRMSLAPYLVKLMISPLWVETMRCPFETESPWAVPSIFVSQSFLPSVAS